jgi:hypothetical protein
LQHIWVSDQPLGDPGQGRDGRVVAGDQQQTLEAGDHLVVHQALVVGLLNSQEDGQAVAPLSVVRRQAAGTASYFWCARSSK